MAKDIDLTGKIAVITGAGSGIGRPTARLLARHGAKVHVADLNAEAAATVAREISGGATHHALDVSRPQDVEALAEAVFQADGRVDVLHNNAGIGHGGDIETTTVEDWLRVIGVNLLGVAYGVQRRNRWRRGYRRSQRHAGPRRPAPARRPPTTPAAQHHSGGSSYRRRQRTRTPGSAIRRRRA